MSFATFRDAFTPPADKPWESFYDATTMLAGLDCSDAPTHDRVYYQHKSFRFIVDGDGDEVPSLDNRETSVAKVLRPAWWPTKPGVTYPLGAQVLRHLCSGASIVTSSYHGALWGMLLRRKVVVVNPHSSKSACDRNWFPQHSQLLPKDGKHRLQTSTPSISSQT